MTTWSYPSKSTTATYTVTHSANGLLSCDCRGWKIKKPGKPRECGHVKDVISKHGLTREVRGDYVFANAPTIPPLSVDDVTIPKGIEDHLADPTTTALEGMKASAIVEERFPKLVVNGLIVPDAFDLTFGNGRWVMEEKLDGHRCIVYKNGDAITTELRSIPTLPPHIVEPMLALPDGIYDGELLVPGGVSTDVPNLALRDELVFAVFDVLSLYGQPITGLPVSDRRDLLEVAVAHMPSQNAVVLVAQYEPSWDTVKTIWGNGGEGVILKRKESRYRPGYRTADWLKVKKLEQHTVTVTGFEAGSLGPTAVTLFKFDDGTKGRCKTLNNHELTATAENPDAYIGRRLVVQCQQRMRGSRSPRHPMWDHWAGEGE